MVISKATLPRFIQDECQCAHSGRVPINLVLMIIVSISECLHFPSASPNVVLYDLWEKAPLSQHCGICEHFFAYSLWRHLVRI